MELGAIGQFGNPVLGLVDLGHNLGLEIVIIPSRYNENIGYTVANYTEVDKI